jgi:hypothetical protein
MKESGHYEYVALRLDGDGMRSEAIGQEMVQPPCHVLIPRPSFTRLRATRMLPHWRDAWGCRHQNSTPLQCLIQRRDDGAEPGPTSQLMVRFLN